MARPMKHINVNAIRVVLVLVAVMLVAAFILIVSNVESNWNSNEKNFSPPASCPCHCDCFEDFTYPFPLETINNSYTNSYADCGKNDPEMQEELQKNMVTLLKEEIDLHKLLTNQSLEHTHQALTRAKTLSYHYKNEAEKCNARMGSCEATREQAEANLMEEIKLTNLWENRARELWLEWYNVHY